VTETDVRKVLSQVLNSQKPNSWGVDYRFLGDAVDSLDQAAFILALQEDYGIRIEDEYIDKLDTITNVIAYVAQVKGN
jgi:acyl carrier protein